MTLVWWIALGLVFWTVVPVPLALLIGRAVRVDVDVEADPASPAHRSRSRESLDA